MTKPETNVEFLARIMEFSPHGALTQAFVIEAIGRYADQCAEQSIPEGSMVSPDAWQNTAKWVQNEIKQKYGRR